MVTIVLLTMPGSDIPKGPVFDLPDFDKLVHIGMFGLLNLLISFPFIKTVKASIRLFFIIALAVLLYGVVMEFVQKYFTVDRNFDILDMAADGTGSFIAYGWVVFRYKRYYKENRGFIIKK